ncbi:MAG TPA: hypothetical protein VFX59_20715 [Polyangiales bacterium]|nr:hypothetical protein [Polyangiales bacterium]
MRQRALWLVSLSLSACYLGPDKHREADDVTVQEAGVQAEDASVVVTLDGSMDATTPPADANDSGYDAGCTSDLQCPLAFPQCRNGDCVACAEANDCARFADTPNCGPNGTCVVCTSDHTQLCTSATPACDTNTNACVQCVADADCPSEAKAACGTNRSCGACTEDADCSRFGKVCDAKSGACVQCRPDTETSDCKDGTACNPKTLTCTKRQRNSVSTCNACDSDTECVTDHRCIPMTFGAEKQDLGGFCLKRASTGCPRMYLRKIARASTNGIAAETYCSIDEAVSSCGALAAFGTSCTNDESCGAPGARCESINGSLNLCSYSCQITADCKSDAFPCSGIDSYCGGT